MVSVSNLGYLVLGVNDLNAWSEFATDILGMQIGEQSDHLLTLRMDQHRYRFMLEKDACDDILAAGWDLSTEGKLNEYVEQLKSRGIAVTKAEPDLLKKRKVLSLFYCEDPNGFKHEFYVGPSQELGVNSFRSKVMRGRFKTGVLGLGHFVVVARNFEESINFYREVLGLKLSGYMEPDELFKVGFFHVKNGRYHTLATGEVPIPKKMMHFAVEVEDFNDVGCALDRAMAAGIPITSSMGHHPNAESTSFYMQSPSGFETEILHGELVVNDNDWQIKTYREFSDWGHKKP